MERLTRELQTVRAQNRLWSRLLAENQETILRIASTNRRLEEENDALWKALRTSSKAHVRLLRFVQMCKGYYNKGSHVSRKVREFYEKISCRRKLGTVMESLEIFPLVTESRGK